MGGKIKLAILSVSAGAGHVRAAQALEKTVIENYPDVEPVHCDVMDYVPHLFRKIYADSYIHIVNRHPTLWKYMYDKSDLVEEDKSAIKQLRIAIEQINTKKLLNEMIKLVPMGFTTTIERPMTASDLAITKPGGLTTSECLAMGLPMIALSPIPGQEESNANYLMENGAGMIANDVIGVEFKVRQLLCNPERLKDMAANATRIGNPDAVAKVLNIVLKDFVK